MENPPGSPRFYEAPDRGVGGPPGSGKEPERKPELEAATEVQSYSRRESLAESLIRSAETPQELFMGLRKVMRKLEDGTTPDGLQERYRPQQLYGDITDRIDEMTYSIDDLKDMGWLVSYNEDGTGKLSSSKYEPTAMRVELVDRPDRVGYERKLYFGTNETREQLKRACEAAKLEFESRNIIGEHLGVRLSVDLRDSLENLVALMHSGRVPKFKVEHLNKMFNLPSVQELEPSLVELRGEKLKEINKELKDLEGLAIRDESQSKRVKELKERKEELENPHELGGQIEGAMWLNLVMLNSGNKQRMLDFLKRPGSIHFMEKFAKEEEARRHEKIKREMHEQGKSDSEILAELEKSRYTMVDWKKEFIGDVDNWVDDRDRYLIDDDKDSPIPWATWRIEAHDKRRGVLTQYSNIVAWGGKPGEFSAGKEKEFIEKTIGGIVGDGDWTRGVEASWIAASIMRATGTYASEGYVALPNGKSLLPLGEGRFMSGDDTGKYWAYMFNYKEGMKGRASGLKDMIGRIPDMAMNLFDWAQVVVGEEPVIKQDGTPLLYPDGTPVMKEKRRSIWDAWLGTPVKDKKDLLTNETAVIWRDENTRVEEKDGKFKVITKDPKTNKERAREIFGRKDKMVNPKTKKEEDVIIEVTEKEDYQPLGKVKFDTLERDFHGTFTIMQWLMGNERGPVGVFIDAMNVEEFRVEDFSLNALKKKWKYIDIVMNPNVLTKGSPQLYSNSYEAPKTIKKNFLHNLMSARIRSAAFAEGILGSTVKVLNRDGTATTDVSVAKLIEMFIKEAETESPNDLSALVKRYVDNFGFLSQAGVLLEAKSVVENAGFRDRVGKVTGK